MGDRIKYLAALILFGTNGVIASQIHLASAQIVLLRTGIGSALLLLIFLLKGGRFHIRSHGRSYFWLTISGIAMGGSWMLLYEAYHYVGVSIASLCMYSSLALVMLSSVFLFNEAVTPQKIICFLVSAGGTLLVNLSAFSEKLSPHGIFLGMMACLSYAVMIITSKFSSAVPDLERSSWQLIVSFLLTVIYTACRGELIFSIPMGDLLWVLLLGLLNTGVGCYLYFSSIGKLPAQTIAICDNIELLSAVLSAVIFLGEHLTAPQSFGAVMILAGAVCSGIRFRKKTY